MTVTLAQVFPVTEGKDIGDVLQNSNFTKIDHALLTPSYGLLNGPTISQMDHNLKVIISGTMNRLAKIPEHERTWEMVLADLMENPLLEPTDDNVHRADMPIKPSNNDLRQLIQSRYIDVEVLENIVAQAGITRQRKVDIVVLRFPYHDRRYFQLYRITLTACDNGFLGEYTSRDFIHRHSVLAYMAWESVVQAAKEADDIFG